jgi:hypothetical protein
MRPDERPEFGPDDAERSTGRKIESALTIGSDDLIEDPFVLFTEWHDDIVNEAHKECGEVGGG